MYVCKYRLTTRKSPNVRKNVFTYLLSTGLEKLLSKGGTTKRISLVVFFILVINSAILFSIICTGKQDQQKNIFE